MKLCTCNHCGKVYEDKNPQSNSVDYPNIDVAPLIMLYEKPNDVSTGYWGCPVCGTDGYLQDEINWNAMSLIDQLILRKKLGGDCTEEESAEIKSYIKEHLVSVNYGDIDVINDIQMLFPLEYGEAINEQKI